MKIISRQEAALKVARIGLKYARMLGKTDTTDRISRWEAIERAVEVEDELTIGWLLSPKALSEFEDEMKQVSI